MEKKASMSIDDFGGNKSSDNVYKKRNNNMARVRRTARRVDDNIKSIDDLHILADELVEKGEGYEETAKRFLFDKRKIEFEISKVESSALNDSDKAGIIAELYDSLDKLKKQYYKDVALEQILLQEEMEGEIDEMTHAIEILQEQEDSLRIVSMDAAAKDTSSAADEAEKKKIAFKNMKDSFLEKKNQQTANAASLFDSIFNL